VESNLLDPLIFTPARLADLENECLDRSTPNLFQFLNKTYIAVEEFCFHPDRYPYDLSIYWRIYDSIKWEQIGFSLLLAACFTLFRYILKKCIFWTRVVELFDTPLSQARLMTPLFNVVAYTFLYVADSYAILQVGETDLMYPLCIFKDIRFKVGYFDQPVPFAYYWVYMLQLGYYIHSFYGTLYLDVKRKDTQVMLAHHVLTVCLLHFSLTVRLYRIGLIVLFLHDISDILLEAAKLVIVLRKHDQLRFRWLEHVGNFIYLAFVISWFSNRVYFFLFKVLYATSWGIYITHIGKEAHFFIFFNLMLWMLYGMQLYWSYFIFMSMMKIVIGAKPLTDLVTTTPSRK